MIFPSSSLPKDQKRDLGTTGRSAFNRTSDTIDSVGITPYQDKRKVSSSNYYKPEPKDLGERFVLLLAVISATSQPQTAKLSHFFRKHLKSIGKFRPQILTFFMISGNCLKRPEKQYATPPPLPFDH